MVKTLSSVPRIHTCIIRYQIFTIDWLSPTSATEKKPLLFSLIEHVKKQIQERAPEVNTSQVYCGGLTSVCKSSNFFYIIFIFISFKWLFSVFMFSKVDS